MRLTCAAACIIATIICRRISGRYTVRYSATSSRACAAYAPGAMPARAAAADAVSHSADVSHNWIRGRRCSPLRVRYEPLAEELGIDYFLSRPSRRRTVPGYAWIARDPGITM